MKQWLLYLLWYLPGYLLCLLVFRLLNQTRVHGSAPCFHRHGCLLVSNHQSALDSWFVGHLCFPRPVWFPAKSDLFDIPIVRHVIAGWRAFPVRRGSHDFAAMSFTVKLLQRYIVLIHPEGTRNPTRQLLPGKVGVGKIIHEARCPVVPVYFEGMDAFLPRNVYFPNMFKRLTIIFGEPIDYGDLLDGESSRDTSQRIIDLTMEALQKVQYEFFNREGITISPDGPDTSPAAQA